MRLQFKKEFYEKYARVVVAIYALIILLRLTETFWVINQYGFNQHVVNSEFFGLLIDLLGASLLVIPYSLLYFLLFRLNKGILNLFNISLLLLAALFFLLVIRFFIYQLIPLDIFLYKYTLREIIFTLRTSSINYVGITISLCLLLLIAIIFIWFSRRMNFNTTSIKFLYLFVLFSLPSFFITKTLLGSEFNKFTLNKPIYFIGKSLDHFMSSDYIPDLNAKEFRELYPDKDFISEEYPLVYEAKRDNLLGTYFNDFDTTPNVVVLIIEGLGDDFIHKYKGAHLMPFLNQLKERSLYWKKCFTLGERSYAAVPSILGGLPYGDIGFTMEKRLPRHLSLVSVLESNDYFTSFFYGQSAWFHENDRFFNHNDVDLVFDNTMFSNNYSKIVFGEDNFFWGYNDKDLFKESFKVIDSLNQKPRFSIYFTGTMHTPYVVNNENYYDDRLQKLAKKPCKEFYQTYSKFLKTMLFTDDALKDYFAEYRKRPDYENTIFIITGDHPMTEIPIKNSLKRYHVPLMVFSEKLKGSYEFSNFVSHLDIPETVISLLKDQLQYTPSISTSLGSQLIEKKTDISKSIAFMNTNREVVDYLHGNHYLAGDRLFVVDSSLNLEEIDNEYIKSDLIRKLKVFNSTCLYATRNNKIISDKEYCQQRHLVDNFTLEKPDSVTFSSEYYTLFDSIKMSNTDVVFDISLNISQFKEGKVNIIYEVTDSNDSLIFWKSFGVAEDMITQIHYPITNLESTDSVLNMRSYIWNQGKTPLFLSELNILLYALNSKNTQHHSYKPHN